MISAKILIVDDEPRVRFFLEKTLSKDGYQVVTVASGEAALQAILAQEFDLALIDLKLGGIGGMEVLATLRQRSPDTVVIVLTAHASLETSVEALRQGAHDYLFKPCKTVELRESIRRGLLDRRQKLKQRDLLRQLKYLASNLEEIGIPVAEPALDPSPDPVQSVDTQKRSLAPQLNTGKQERFLRYGQLIVDVLQHIVTLDDYLLELSPTEFDLLAYLVSETPRVVSPQELLREVQGYESESWEASDSVRYHIHNLRQKIKKTTGRKDVISTVRGVGYKIGSKE